MTDDSPAERLRKLQAEHELPASAVDQLTTLQESVADLEQQRDQLAAELQKTNDGLLELTAELQDAERRYRRLFETSAEGIYTIDTALTQYDLVNPSFSEILGYDNGDALLEAVDSVADDVFVSGTRFAEYADRLRETGRLDSFEYRVQQSTGEPRWVSDNVISITDDDETVEGYRGGVIDITERKRKEKELRQFRQATEAAGHAIFLVETDGTITYANQAFEEITGYSAEEAIGTKAEVLTVADSNTSYQRFWETIPSDGKWEGRIVNQRNSGEYYHARQTIAPITDDSGEIGKFVGIQTDITRQVERERQVNALDRVLRHNLRNSLNVIKGRAEMAAEQTDNESIHAALDQILSTADELIETADEGREITRLLATRADRDTRKLDSIVAEAVADLQTRYPEATIETDLQAGASAVAVDSIDRAIEELIDNAIGHNDADPHVWVTLRPTEKEVLIEVVDDGPGVPEFDKHVFEDPERGDELSHGSGLGLWLVYWIVRRSGGELEYEERPAGGSLVTVRLPRACKPEPPHTANT